MKDLIKKKKEANNSSSSVGPQNKEEKQKFHSEDRFVGM